VFPPRNLSEMKMIVIPQPHPEPAEIPGETLGIFGATPVITWQPSGEPLTLPWRS